MNILIKLTCLVGLVIAPLLGSHASTHSEVISKEIRKEISVDVSADGAGQMEAVIKTTTQENGEVVEEVQTISGSEKEVEAAIKEIKDVEILVKKE